MGTGDIGRWLEEEFWWLLRLEKPITGWVGLARNVWTPPPERPGWVECQAKVELENVPNWADGHGWENVHRTLAVYQQPESHFGIVGPFVVDIDGREEDDGSVLRNILERTAAITHDIGMYYRNRGVSEDHLRIYRSGHKGFHVHLALPDQFDFSTLATWKQTWRTELETLRRAVLRPEPSLSIDSPLSIDQPHNHTRLRNSWNVWSNRGRCERISLDELGL